MVMSHLGRPKAGKPDPKSSLAPVAAKLGELLGAKVPLVTNWLDGVDVAPGELVLCENVRYDEGEEADDDELAKRMAKLCDVFVMDAFGTAHRAQASTQRRRAATRPSRAPVRCSSPSSMRSRRRSTSPKRPVLAIIGGSKVSTKIEVLQSLSTKVDELILGGGIANTFLRRGRHRRQVAATRQTCRPREAPARGEFGKAEIPLPTDVVVAHEPRRRAREAASSAIATSRATR